MTGRPRSNDERVGVTLRLPADLRDRLSEAALERERGAVRAGVQAWRVLPAGQPGGALWDALARADEAGALDPAIYIWLLDAELVPGFLVYRRDHYAELVDYIRTFLVVLPAK